jgi:hypothetical protein
MAYANLRLKQTDCAFIDEILNRGIAVIQKNSQSVSSEKEGDFYADALKKYAELRSKVSAPGGKISLTEEQLRTLRGALFGSERNVVGKAFAAAHQAGDDALASVYREKLNRLELLDDILSKPLVNDRSQDVDEDEEDEGGGDGDDPAEN